MSTISLLYLCPNCHKQVTITKDEKATTSNLILCPNEGCNKNLFPNVKNPDKLLEDFNNVEEINHG
jgi:hypothetical protein